MAPVNETDMVLLPKGLKALKQVATEAGVDLRDAYLNLDGGSAIPAARIKVLGDPIISSVRQPVGCLYPAFETLF